MDYSYDQYHRKVYAYDGKIVIAILNVTDNEFEEFEKMSKDDSDTHYNNMVKEYEDFKTFIKYCD